MMSMLATLDTIASPSDLECVLSRLSEARVTVFGDYCLDAYWSLDTGEEELSIETGLPVRRVRQQRYSLGGAGNVVANLVDLGVRQVRAVGVIGQDPFGAEILRLLRERGADTAGILVPGEPYQTMVYAKPCRADVEDRRLDFGAFNQLSEEATASLITALERAADASTVVVLNQQVPGGISTPEAIAQINRVIAAHPRVRFIVDARHRAALFSGALYKLNMREAGLMLDQQSCGSSSSQARAFARQLCEKTGLPVFLTRGENGMVVADQTTVREIPGIQVSSRTDPVGAGDTAVAALAAVLGSGGDPLEAGTLANIAASVTVRKLQTTGTATPQEIRSLAADLNYVYSPELADDPRHARFVEGTEIELAADVPGHLSIQHAIFDHDGTISTLRQGWEPIMEDMMVRGVLGASFDTAGEDIYRTVTDTVRKFIDQTTGIQTLVQMQGMVAMVREFGFVPEAEILDEHGYKHIYNEQLLKVVRQRITRLERGELESRDFQIKNALPLLEHLHRKGVKLYLASGTDEVDVVREAKALGYADLFEGRIFGAVGDVNVEAKKLVLERIIRDYNLSGHEFATFGDGPVEIRETNKRGGICVGVASDELRRFGLNPAKRSRLIRAGAQIIVPDFSQLPALLHLLQLD